jgi:hypothetical protein
MKIEEIATVSGKGGLFKVLAPTKSGVILESIDDAKTKMIATSNQKLSLLNEISIYTTTKEGTVALDYVLRKIKNEYGNDLGVDANSDPVELKAFLKSVLPEYDDDRVYVSDIKKLVKWYEIIFNRAPEILEEQKEEVKPEKKAESKKSDDKSTESPKNKVEPVEAESKKQKAESKEAKKEMPKAEKKSEAPKSKGKDKASGKKKK